MGGAALQKIKIKRNEKKTCILKRSVLIYLSAMEARYAPVAQLDRVTGYEPVGRGFESLPAYQNTMVLNKTIVFFYWN